ncbi:hypothetical protein ACFFIY_02710 [Bhargavaea ullalensis]|uniref:DUF4175 domain-containing protein n=1 Tax=Bhargavaea ullalensis TaxID=1265685 RepID=A0ABV2GBZ2_9BACL
MDSSALLERMIGKVRRRLGVLWAARQGLRGVAWGIWAAAALLLATRFFVLPGYLFYAAGTFTAVLAAVLIAGRQSVPGRKQALFALDRHVPDNLILAAGSLNGHSGPLEARLLEEAAGRADAALAGFRKEKRHWVERKTLFWAAAGLGVLLVSGLFPSSAQQEAKETELERSIVTSLQKQVHRLRERTAEDEVGKQLADLAAVLGKTERPEEAIRETVKLQRELSLRDRMGDTGERPDIDGNGLSAGETASELAQMAGDADERLSSLGRSAADNGGEPPLAVKEDPADSGGGDGGGRGSGGENGDTPNGRAPGSAEGSEKGSGQGSDGSGEDPDAVGEGEGTTGEKAPGSGEPDSSGSETGGKGDGADGQGGKGAGSGRGSRTLVSTPPPDMTHRDPTSDSGPVRPGGTPEKGRVPAEKGTVRPYGEALGDYRDAYLESAGQLGLPEELQRVLSEYFSSLEKED